MRSPATRSFIPTQLRSLMRTLHLRSLSLLCLLAVCCLAVVRADGTPQQLRITGLRSYYSAPYLLDFNFSVRDESNRVVVVNPSEFTLVCKENGTAISASETGFRLLADNKQLKCLLVLDYTLGMLDPVLNGDTDGDYVSDSAEAMEAGAKALLGALSKDAETALFEFHRADAGYPSQKLAGLTRDKGYLTNQINQIWNRVVWTSGSTRCWDALQLALSELPTENPADDQRFLVFVSDGKDESSTYTPSQVIALALVKGVKIYCVGYGQGLTTAPLLSITEQTGGQYYGAGSAAEITQRFQRIAQELRSQYILRWATLKRSSSAFTPSFELTYSGIKTGATPNAYYPPSYVGDELQGHLRFDASLSPSNVASLVLRAAYIPRGITRLRLNFATTWPFTVKRVPFAEGGVCPTNWTFTVNQSGGIGYLEFQSSAPANPFTALPYATLGKLVEFEFQGVTQLTNCFYDLGMDNTVYAQPGGPSFVIDNSTNVSSMSVILPHGTPAWWLNQYGFTSGLVLAEITDHDGDGALTWQEYLAGTNPTNAASVFRLRHAIPGSNGRQFTFNTEKDRAYRVDYSETLTSWSVLQTGIVGDGNPRTVVDPTVRARRFYRAVMTGVAAPSGMAAIPAGSFTMGDTFNDGASAERPAHAVEVRAFYLDRYEVTKALWDAVKVWADANSYGFDNLGWGKATNHPVHTVNWYDVVKWCNARSAQEGLTLCYYTDAALTIPYKTGQVAPYVKWDANGYRLPTEAEWEKAARGGVVGRRFPWSDADTITHSRANYFSSTDYVYDVSLTRGYHPSFQTGATPYTSPVGYFAPNGYDLYDMAGNVYEWCWDWYDASWYSNAGATQSDTRGPTTGTSRLIRGGYWHYGANNLRCAYRYGYSQSSADGTVGFRCARGL